ncbi:MAG TPA: metal-dependent hydrolase [Planctomycetaceae bacterium]|nr:metal-dependent hydrolase [Rubinisphaera sp.]HCS54877.1 metal-dependent hydrolase [Planctomycetaceae bacterium]|tara:strand:+ start:10018 stop:11013 length:996 start_codon:yes stop_codon:yes gene_type:complete
MVSVFELEFSKTAPPSHESLKLTAESMDWSKQREKLLGNSQDLELPPNFKLPVLPTAVTTFTQKANEPDANVAELGKILETDAGLTAEILQLVNSSVFGLRRQATSVKHAMSLLGVSKARNYVLTTAVKRTMSRCESKLINLNHFWSANLEKALFAREVAILMKADAETAYAASMLQDFLLPALTSALFKQYSEFVDYQATKPQLITQFEQTIFEWDHAVAAAHIAHQWNFPDEMVCCLHQHHRGLEILLVPEFAHSCVAAVAISALLPDVINQVPDGLTRLIQLETVWREFKLQELAEKVDQDFRELGGDQMHHITLKSRLEKHFKTAGV